MTDKFISQEEAKTIVAMGFNVDEWKGEKYLELIPGSKRQERDEEQYMLVEVTDAITLPKLRIDQAAKWLREQCGVDLVVSPRFDSATGERKGYFVRWLEKARHFDPLGHAGLTLLGKIVLTPSGKIKMTPLPGHLKGQTYFAQRGQIFAAARGQTATPFPMVSENGPAH